MSRVRVSSPADLPTPSKSQSPTDKEERMPSKADTATSIEMKLEVVPIPVSDVDAAKAFYSEKVGFHLDHDVRPTQVMRVLQMTPPGRTCWAVSGEGLPLGKPGSV